MREGGRREEEREEGMEGKKECVKEESREKNEDIGEVWRNLNHWLPGVTIHDNIWHAFSWSGLRARVRLRAASAGMEVCVCVQR